MTKDYRDRFYHNYNEDQQRRREEGVECSETGSGTDIARVILPMLPNDREAKILDAGCGSGHLLSKLKEYGYKNIKGVDVSRDQIEAARRQGVTNIEEADLHEYFEHSQEQWNVMLAIDLIEHFTKEEAVSLLEQMYHKLHEGGKLIVRTPNIDAPFGSVYAYGDFTHRMILNKSSAIQLFKTIGFSRIEVGSTSPTFHNGIKGLMQRIARSVVTVGIKGIFFAFGRSIQQVEIGPNLLVKATKLRDEHQGNRD